MITYNNGNFGLISVLFRFHGSALYKAIIPALISTSILIAMHYSNLYAAGNPVSDMVSKWFLHPYPIASMFVAFTFLLTFKASFSYNRYWEACTSIHQMHSKWLDVAMNMAAFHMQSKKFENDVPPSFGLHPGLSSVVRTRKRYKKMTSRSLEELVEKVEKQEDSFFKKMFSSKKKRQKYESQDNTKEGDNLNGTDTDLNYVPDRQLFAQEKSKSSVSITSLRNTDNMIPVPTRLLHTNSSLSPNTPKDQPVMTNTPSMRSSIERLKSVAKLDGGVKQHEPSLFLQEGAHLISLLSAVAFSTLRGDVEGAETPLCAYKRSKPWPSVDPYKDDFTSSLWDNFMTTVRYFFDSSRTTCRRTIYNAKRPFSVLGGVSDAEAELLKSARGSLAKTALCEFWVTEFITRESLNGSTGGVAPPIISRLHQYLSDGMLGYNQTRKVAYIPFPFVHNQLTAFYVLVMIVFIPILMLSYVNYFLLACILNTLTVSVFVGLYEVAKELEDPIRNVPNDLPLNNFQAQFNEALIVMYAGYHPEAWWEVESEEDPTIDNDSQEP